MKLKVYVESTIPSFYHEVRTEPEMVARREWTRQWWDERSGDYDVVTSVAVIDELSREEQVRPDPACQHPARLVRAHDRDASRVTWRRCRVMKEDPTIRRIREARHEISEANQHDPEKLVEYHLELQKKYAKRLAPTPAPHP